MADGQNLFQTIGRAERDSVTLRGKDLCGELIGHLTFAQMTNLMLVGKVPDENQARMIDALLVALVEHGFTSSAMAARLVYHAAPESLQGAVAAAILTAGGRHLGTADLCARMLQDNLKPEVRQGRSLEALAEEIVAKYRATKTNIAGIGHATHTGGDPRADRLFEVARETGVYGDACELIQIISKQASAQVGRNLPVNVTGAMGSISTEMGVDWHLAKAYAIIGRALGALAHLGDEIKNPIARGISQLVEHGVEYREQS